jgi:O-antigen/teichoic acid export membrane protein
MTAKRTQAEAKAPGAMDGQDQGEAIKAEIVSEDATVAVAGGGSSTVLRARLRSGSMIMLFSSGLVGATNFIYNIGIARILGAAQFGHATAIYTLLMLLSSVTLAFQIVCSKFVAKNIEIPAKVAVYKKLHQLSWQISIATGILIISASSAVTSYLKLPDTNYVVLLGLGTAIYIPLGVRRGLMQGAYDFRRLAENFVLEVLVKLGGALLLLHFGMGVTGVILAVVASIVVAYVAGRPGEQFRIPARAGLPASFDEGMQATVFFVGQVTINNLDIILVKHFFPAPLAGLYAAVALVGRVVYMLSWSIVSSMFPVSAGSSHERSGRAVMGTALLLVMLVASLFTLGVWLAPNSLWTMILGSGFATQSQGSFSSLLVLYAALTGIYSFSVVIMTYEISRRIGNASWLQLGFSGAIAVGICLYHSTLRDVIAIQLVLMILLLVAVSVPFLRIQAAQERSASPGKLDKLRKVQEEEVIAEFIKAEFYQPEFDPYRQKYSAIVYHPDLDNKHENAARRALLFRRRGRMWRELPEDTVWWEVEFKEDTLARIRAFPRKQWRKFANGSFYLTGMIEKIRKNIQSRDLSQFNLKMRAVLEDLNENVVPDSVLLIGVDEQSPLTIIEGNHRMAAAMMLSPDDVHRRFRFYCGLSANMTQCCWYQTDFITLSRYARNIVRYMFRDRDYFVQRALRTQIETEITQSRNA